MCLLGGYPASINPNKPQAGPQFEGSQLYNRSTRLTTEFYDTSTGYAEACPPADPFARLLSEQRECARMWIDRI